jgi:hypothetical protein
LLKKDTSQIKYLASDQSRRFVQCLAKRMIYSLFVVFAILSVVSGKIYFQEDFNDAGWKDRWTVSSDWKPKVMNASRNFSFIHLD